MKSSDSASCLGSCLFCQFRNQETDAYWWVQNLGAVNQTTVTLHLVVPKLCTLLSLIPNEAAFFTCLDLKDAFFWICLAPLSQPIFAFQWENPENCDKDQLAWTRLPQGFKNPPTIFCTALASDLKAFPASQHGYTQLQYMDNLLLAGQTQEEYMERMSLLLIFLWEADYKVSKKKAHICQEKVKYLGFHLSQGQCQLTADRKQAVCSVPLPSTWQQFWEFLRAAGFRRIWIPSFSILTKPLFEATKRGEWESMLWEWMQQKAFEEIKWALTNMPGLGLPDIFKPFFLYMHEHTNISVPICWGHGVVQCHTSSSNLTPLPKDGHLVYGHLQPWLS